MIGANKKKKVSEFATPYTVGNALTKGGAAVKLSALVMGLANMAHKQIIKGLIFLAIEIAYICLLYTSHCGCLLYLRIHLAHLSYLSGLMKYHRTDRFACLLYRHNTAV